LSKLTLPAERQIAAFTPRGIFFLSFLNLSIYLFIYLFILTIGNVSAASCAWALSVVQAKLPTLKSDSSKETKVVHKLSCFSDSIIEPFEQTEEGFLQVKKKET